MFRATLDRRPVNGRSRDWQTGCYLNRSRQLSDSLPIMTRRLIIGLFSSQPARNSLGLAPCIFEQPREIELIVKTNIATDGRYRHPARSKSSFAWLIRWSSRQLKTLIPGTRWRKDVTDATATSKHAVRRWRYQNCCLPGDRVTRQASRTRLSIGGWSDSLIASMRRSNSCPNRFIASSSE